MKNFHLPLWLVNNLFDLNDKKICLGFTTWWIYMYMYITKYYMYINLVWQVLKEYENWSSNRCVFCLIFTTQLIHPLVSCSYIHKYHIYISIYIYIYIYISYYICYIYCIYIHQYIYLYNTRTTLLQYEYLKCSTNYRVI